jgi:hypothetical protein
MKVFQTETFEDFIKRVEGKDLEISSEIYSKITKAHKRNFKKVKVFTVSLRNGDQFDFEIDRSEWSKALNTCMDTFASNDMFEECIEIKTLLKQLK